MINILAAISRAGRKLAQVAIAVTVVSVFIALPSSSAGNEAARSTLEKWEKAVVTVQYVVKMRMSVEGREAQTHEEQAEVTATIVDPSGLTVIPLSVTDPSEAMGLGDDTMASLGVKFDFKVEMADIKIRLADGKEIPASVALRDRDLDLVFLKPTQALDAPLPYVDLTSDYAPDVMDTVVTLARLGKAANRTIAASVSRVQAVVDKPRKFYVMRVPHTMGELGCPVFSLDGKLAGIRMLRSIPMDRSFRGDNMLPVVIPTSDIAEVAKQALAAKGE